MTTATRRSLREPREHRASAQPTTVEAPSSSRPAPPTRDIIRARAYDIYLARAGGPGDALQDWLQAERELRARWALAGEVRGADLAARARGEALLAGDAK